MYTHMHLHTYTLCIASGSLIAAPPDTQDGLFSTVPSLGRRSVMAPTTIHFNQSDQNAQITLYIADFCWVMCQCTKVCAGVQGSGMLGPEHKTVESGMLTFSFSPFLPRTLPRHSLQFHSTSFNLLTGRKSRGQEVHPTPTPLPSPSSSLVCESWSKFGSVISSWPEPVFVRIILHRCLGLKP